MDPAPSLFDRRLLRARQGRARRAGGESADFLLRSAADDIVDRLSAVKRHFGMAVDLGALTAYLGDRLLASGRVDSVVRLGDVERSAGEEARLTVRADEELLPLAPASVDLVVSALVLHHVNDLPGTLAQIRRALRPDGLFLGALLGGDTLVELRAALTAAEVEITGGAAPRVAPFAEVRVLGGLLQRAGFALPVVDQDRVTVRYGDAFSLMRDLRAMGATSVLAKRARRPLRRSVLFRAAEIYRDRFADADGRIRATFDIVSLSGWAPHESQQRPLAPGSAKVRLADALGVDERRLRDR